MLRNSVPGMVDVKPDLHTIFVEVISRGGIEKVRRTTSCRFVGEL